MDNHTVKPHFNKLENLTVGNRLHCSSETLAELLDKTRWAKDFTWPDLSKMCDYMAAYEIDSGEVLFEEGDINQFMALLVKGRVEIYKADLNRKYTKISIISAPQSLGEMGLLDGQPRSAKAVAKDNVLLLTLSRNSLVELADTHPHVAFRLIWKLGQMMSSRLRQASGQLVDFLGENLTAPKSMQKSPKKQD